MSIKKYNTYFKEEDGKIYYYDENGEKKYVPSTAFSNLQEQIDNLSPLTYSGSKTVDEINALTNIKRGDVYTITGDMGVISAGNITVVSGDEIAWADEWFIIGKDTDTKELSAGENIKIEEIAGTSTETPKTVISVTDKKNLYVDPATMWLVNNSAGVTVGVKDCPDDGNTYVRKRGQWIYNENDGNSWKKWSEEHGSSGVENNFYIGTNNIGEEQGINIGIENEILSSDSISGASINLGNRNKSSLKSINIGFENETYGKSIGLGWDNRVIKDDYEHSILIGFSNSANNNIQNISDKNIDVYHFLNYTREEINAAYTRYNNAYESVVNNNVMAFDVYCSNLFYDSDYINVAGPNYYYDSQSNALIPYDWSAEGCYILLTYDQQSVIYEQYEQGYIQSEYVYKYRFMSQSTFDRLVTIVTNTTQQSYNMYAEFTAASSTYYTMSNSNHTYQPAKNELSPETISLVVGSNNSAEHHNSYMFGSCNQSFSSVSDVSNDDGFVFTLGLGNKVARNYDMAIGYNALASGGENIAIGAPQETNKLSNSDYLYTNAIGYKNIAIRSTLTGVENIAVNSIVTNPYEYTSNTANTENLFLNAYISSYNDMHYSIFSNIAPGFNNGYPINLGRVSYSFIHNTLISNSNSNSINASLIFSNRMYADDGITINNSNINRSLVGFGENPITNSKIDASIFGFNSSAYNADNVAASIVVKSKVSGLLSETLAIGSNLSNVVGSIVATDNIDGSEGNNVQYVSRSLLIGDNTVIGASMNSPNENNFIMGTENKIPQYSWSDIVFGHKNIFKSDNTFIDVFGEENSTLKGYYNRIFGANNQFAGNYNEIFGTQNEILHEDIDLSYYYDWSYFQNNTTPKQKARSYAETTGVLNTTQRLSYNSVYIYDDDNPNHKQWKGIPDYIDNSPYRYASNLYFYNGYMWYPPNSADFVATGFATRTYYMSWQSFYTNHYLKDYITREMYNALPSSEQSLYSYYGSVGGKSLYYRTIDWRVNNRTTIYSAVPIVTGQYSTSQNTAYCHFIMYDYSALPQIRSDVDLMDFGVPQKDNMIRTTADDYLWAKLGITTVFSPEDNLIADEQVPNDWVTYDIYKKPDTLYFNNVRGSFNYLYDASQVVHSNIFGTQNTISGHNSYLFIEGSMNQIKSDDDNAYITMLGGNNIITTGKNYHTMLVGQNNSSNSGILSLAFGSDNSVNSACSIAMGEGLIAYWNQTVIGKFNEELPNDTYYRFKYKWNETTQQPETQDISGVLFTVGNGYLDNCYEKDNSFYTLNGDRVPTVIDNSFIKRSNAMIVSANGTVSAGDFAISGGYKLSDISAVLELLNNKPATGQPYVMGLDNNGNLTWMSI